MRRTECICQGSWGIDKDVYKRQLAALQHDTILDFLFTDNLLFAFAPFEIITGIVVIGLAGFSDVYKRQSITWTS